MLGGVRGALSIVLATTITVSAVISASDIRTISTMALGVAFISITIQVPLLFNYVKRKIKGQEESQAEKFGEKLAKVCSSVDETRKLVAEGRISDEELTERLEEDKEELEQVIESSSLLETSKIIKRRASLLFRSVAKDRAGKKKSSRKKSKKVSDKKEEGSKK